MASASASQLDLEDDDNFNDSAIGFKSAAEATGHAHKGSGKKVLVPQMPEWKKKLG